jgi:hypothetical protein
MKRITRLLLVLAFAGAILSPIAIHFNNSLNNTRQIADGGGSVPPWPGC